MGRDDRPLPRSREHAEIVEAHRRVRDVPARRRCGRLEDATPRSPAADGCEQARWPEAPPRPVSWLAQSAPLPSDPAARESLTVLAETAARLSAAREAGRPIEGAGAIDDAIAAADALGYV